MTRKFEKISFKQFKKDISDDKKSYESYNLPMRKTMYSAGYDFEAIEDYKIIKGESLKIPTGIKAQFNSNEVLLLAIRSSFGFKYNVRMCNQIGIIDSDYYNNEDNEGHICLKLQNEGNDDFFIKKGMAICQGIFTNYLTVDNEQLIKNSRKGGLGSTTKGEDNNE